LLAALREDVITDPQAQRLVELLRANTDARRMYIHYMALVANLRGSLADSRPPRPHFLEAAPEMDAGAPIILDLSPARHSPLFTLHSPLGSFLFSYLAGAMLLGIGLLIGWTWKIHYDRQFARDVPRQTPRADVPETPMVGRVTGAADCLWADSATEAFEHDGVPLGREYVLLSGFLEITYDSGARVILQGPATFAVESKQGGFLSLGKLTAWVEKKGSRVWGHGSGKINPKFQISNQQIPSPLSPLPSPLFSVRTPTAMVTDLGTEFGVEVERSGASMAHVFQGRIEVRPASGGNFRSPTGAEAGSAVGAIRLGANESARAEVGPNRIAAVVRVVGQPIAFARRMPKRPQTGPVRQSPKGAISAAAAVYRLTDLGTLGGADSCATAINAAGQVVGEANIDASATKHAFLYSAGKMEDLGTLRGGNSHAFDINAAGQVVGDSGTNDDDCRAFLYSRGTMKDLGSLGGATSSAIAINAAGQVVGVSRDAGGHSHAFLYSNGRMTRLAVPGADSWAYDINAEAEVVGCSAVDGGALRAFLYDGRKMRNLGSLGGSISCAYSMNGNRQVAGCSVVADSPGVHAFLYSSATGMKDLGTLGGAESMAFSINAGGQVVGRADTAAADSHAFLYNGAAGTMIDLNTLIDPALGWTLVDAKAISDSGQIVGQGATPDGNTRAFVLTPVSKTSKTGTMEPSTIGGERRVSPMK